MTTFLLSLADKEFGLMTNILKIVGLHSDREGEIIHYISVPTNRLHPVVSQLASSKI